MPRPVMSEQIIPTAPFDFVKMLQRPLSRPSKISWIDLKAQSFTRALRLNGRIVPVTVTNSGTIDNPVLCLTYPDHLSETWRERVKQQIQRMFSTTVSVHDFYEQMGHHGPWAELIKQHYGLRPIQDVGLFESMVKVIIGQQLNVRFAATLVERLIDFAGDTVEWHGQVLPVFPSPEQVASWSYEDLRVLSFSQRKAEYIIDFARLISDGRIDFASFWSLPDEVVYETLVPYRGIGRWTVECFLLFGMGRTDVIPAADIGVQNAVQKLYHLDRRPTDVEVRQWAEPWAPWRSYATYYLWQSLIRPR